MKDEKNKLWHALDEIITANDETISFGAHDSIVALVNKFCENERSMVYEAIEQLVTSNRKTYYDDKHKAWDELKKAIPDIDEWMNNPNRVSTSLVLFPIRTSNGRFRLGLEELR